MGRKALAVIVAMITAGSIICVGLMVSTITAPNTPKNLEYLPIRDIDAYAQSLPTKAFVTVLIFYVIAAFAGGFISTKIGRRWSEGASIPLLVGILLTVGCLLASFILPQPIWLVLATLVAFIPISLIGYRFAR